MPDPELPAALNETEVVGTLHRLNALYMGAFSHARYYWHNGGIASPPHSPARGVEHHARPNPFSDPQKSPICRQNDPRVRESSSFGCGDGLVFAWLPHPRKYCHNGAWPSPTTTAGLAGREGVPARGVRDRHR